MFKCVWPCARATVLGEFDSFGSCTLPVCLGNHLSKLLCVFVCGFGLVSMRNRAWPCPLLLWLQASWPLLETSDRLQHSMPETWSCDSGFGTGSQGGNYWEEGWPCSLPHQYSSEWMYSSIRCLFLHCSVVWQYCKQQQHALNRCNTACLLAGITNLSITHVHAI